jgi:hypothetical protein
VWDLGTTSVALIPCPGEEVQWASLFGLSTTAYAHDISVVEGP